MKKLDDLSTNAPLSRANMYKWLHDKAYPLWSTAGLDVETTTAWEALDHQGHPRAKMVRRLRVQVRQAYCFAKSEDPAIREIGEQLFRFAMEKGFDPATGNLAARLHPDLTIQTAPHDLYDMAFMLLAAAALIDAGFAIEGDLQRLEASLARLKAPRGWFETAARALPRRQNPHMHLFEATTALYQVTGAERFRNQAEECLSLFREIFLRPTGEILEYFDEGWRPYAGDEQAVEPGHMAEWIYLLDRFEEATGTASGVDLKPLFDEVLARRGPDGFLPDQSEPMLSETRRLWPQTELLKAGIVILKRGYQIQNEAHPRRISELIWRDYLDTSVLGGWYDSRTLRGDLVSEIMPASSFYHLQVAFELYDKAPLPSLEA